MLAAGPARVAAWVRDCLLPDVRLVPGTRRLGAAGATWAVRDGLGCYWRARPAGFRPAWDVAPGEGTLTVAVAGGRIATLTVVYSPAWEARLLTAQAAPFRTAQARATAARPATAGATQTPAARQGARGAEPAGPPDAVGRALARRPRGRARRRRPAGAAPPPARSAVAPHRPDDALE